MPNELYFNDAMPSPYDVALRERAVKAYESGEGTYVELAALFHLHHRTLERWVARFRETGSAAAFPKGGGWQSPIDREALEAVVRETPDAPLRELCRTYNRRVPRAQRTTRSSFHRALKNAGFVLKKNDHGRANLIARTWQPSVRRS